MNPLNTNQNKLLMKELQPVLHNNILWKQPAVPRHVCQLLIVDPKALMMLIHRSVENRSARDVWSMPSGTHELGETNMECVVREMREELALEPQRIQVLDQYENIAGDSDNPGDEQYHWVITLFMVMVEDISKYQNREPHKHDQILTVNYGILEDEMFLENHKFHPSLQSVLERNRFHYHNMVKFFIEPFAVDPSEVASLTIMPTIEDL